MTKQWKSEEELSQAIRKLMYRVDVLTAPSVEADIRVNAVNVEVLESAFSNTIREVFGEDSPEFADFGTTRMLRGPIHVGMSRAEIAQARLRGREYMVQVCGELITRLQQKILEHREDIASGASPASLNELHPAIAKASLDLAANGHAWEAVFAAGKALVLHVKARSGRHDLDGIALMRTVFSKHNPVLRFSTLATQTDLDEQEGMMHLYEGAVMALRNPGGHGFPEGPSERAAQYIQLLSLLAYRADEAAP